MTLTQARLRKWLGYPLFLPFCGSLILFMKWGLRYRVRDLKRLRAEFQELARDPRPLLICSNHLTFVDSVLIIYAFANHWWYLFHYRCLSWNLPAVEYKSNAFFRTVCTLAKCIFIDRGGTRAHHQQVLDTARALLERREVVTIFPEGRRSKTGRFDDAKLAYGIGKIVTGMKECRVACLYLRSEDQKEKGSFPPQGTQFTLLKDVIVFKDPPQGTEGVRAVTTAIAENIKRLEARYFAEHS